MADEADRSKSARKDPEPVAQVLVLGIHVVVAIRGEVPDWCARDKSEKK